jgi:hypothetical protein
VRGKNFNLSMSSRLALGSTQPPVQCVPWVLSPGVKKPGRETDHSQTSAETIGFIYIHFPVRIHGIVPN